MKISTIICVSLLGIICLSTKLVLAERLESRAIQNFGVNCQLNQYANKEFELGMTYLNATIYMMRDRVALFGFGKMFKKFWRDQLEFTNMIGGYITQRGGVVETPGVRTQFFNNLNSIDYFQNESMLITKFLDEEKYLNKRLLDLHKATSFENTDEVECVKKYGGKQLKHYAMTSTLDPHSSHFLDENFISQKVKRIKFLADLLRKINRFDQHPKNIEGVSHNLNQLGIYILDNELNETFS